MKIKNVEEENKIFILKITKLEENEILNSKIMKIDTLLIILKYKQSKL